jgi:hypothetical protein
VAVAERLLAIQAQDARGARLAVRARSGGLSTSDVDHALSEDRSLLITWLNRGTLHLARTEDYHWLHALTTPPLFTNSARRLAQEGVPPRAAERGVAVVERALAEEGPLTRNDLRERVAAAKVRTEGQALVHVLMLASLRGLIVRGPMAGSDQCFVLTRDWLPRAPRVDRDAALAELARRYLAGHGPATDADLARWSGLPLRDARAGLAAIGSELVEREPGVVRLKGRRSTAKLPPPRLLGPYDPVLLGWTSREPILGDRKDVVTMNGVFRPFAMVEGRAAGIWSLPGGRVKLEPFGRLQPAVSAALEREAADVERFLAG